MLDLSDDYIDGGCKVIELLERTLAPGQQHMLITRYPDRRLPLAFIHEAW